MSKKPPKIVIPGLNRGAGVPASYMVGRLKGQGPAQLLNLTQVRRFGVATVAGVAQTAASLSSAVSTVVQSYNPAMLLGSDGGEDGSPGPPGVAGAAGAAGAAGQRGADGIDGLDGADGMPIPGIPGAAGAAGAAGATGPQGPIGFGLDGIDGEEGMAIPGLPGAAGAAGATGPAGPIGLALDGADGTDGMPIPGDRGATGAAGSAGATGPQGPIGFAIDGIDGEEGMPIPGVQGTAGANSLTVGAFDTLSTAQADTGNSTTVETDIYTFTVPASQLGTNGDRVEMEASGAFVSSGTATRQLRAYFGGTMIFDTGALTISLAAAWDIYCIITRVSATVVRYAVSMTTEGAALAAYTSSGEVTGLTLSNTNIIKVTGTAAGVGAATNDIVCKMGAVDFKPSTPDIISSAARGDILYRNAAVWTRLPAGTSGQVLQTNGAGADPSWVTASGGLPVLEQHTASSSASLDFTIAISSTYDEYLIEFINIIPATNATRVQMRMSTNGGSTYDSGTNYSYNVWGANRFSNGTSVGVDSGGTEIRMMQSAGDNTSTAGIIGFARLFSPGSTSLHKAVRGEIGFLTSAVVETAQFTGWYRSTTAVNAFQFLMASGNIASGTIRVFGIPK